MKKRTRKWAFVSQEAARLAGLGLSPREIAERLGVDKSSVTRWMKAGKLERRPPSLAPGATQPKQSPAEWAASVREAYDLDATDDQLVTIAETALALSLDRNVAAHVRMTAAGRFQAIVRQLALVARAADKDAAPEKSPAPSTPEPARAARGPERIIRRPGGDPRKLLMAIK